MLNIFLSTSGYLFWILILFMLVADTLALATDDDVMGSGAVVVTTGAFLFTTAFTDAFVGINILWLVVGLGLYLLLGVAWSFKKWIDYVIEQKRHASELYDRTDKKKTFEEFSTQYKPEAVNNKQRIITCMTVWPLSFSWWVLTYPRHFFVWAYNRLSTVFDRVTAKIWTQN